MGTANDDRARYTSAGAWVLLDVMIGGQVFRFSTASVDVTTPDGVERYVGGLSIGSVDDAIGAEGRTLAVQIRAPLAAWATLAARGVILEGSAAVLSLWAPGDPRPVEMLRGTLTGVLWADPEDPDTLSATLDGTPWSGAALVPGEDAEVSPRTWPVRSSPTTFTTDPAAYGEKYPVIYGRPGCAPASGLTEAPGSPIHTVEYTASAAFAGAGRSLVADGSSIQDGSTVTVWDTSAGASVAGVTTAKMADLLGRTVGYVRHGAYAGTFGGTYPGRALWVSWTSGGGWYRTLGDVLVDLLRRARLRVDLGRCYEQAGFLSGYLVDAVINADTDPIAWIRAHVLPVFPVALATGPGGWFFYALRTDLGVEDAIATLDADAGRVVRTSGVQTSPWSEIVNRLTLAYALQGDSGTYRARVGVENVSSVSASFGLATIVSTGPALASAGMPWGSRSLRLESRVISDRNTAIAAATSLVARRAFPVRRAVYSVGREFLGLYPGAVVLVKDAAAGFVGRGGLAIVEARSIAPGGDAMGVRASLTIRTVSDVPNPRRIT